MKLCAAITGFLGEYIARFSSGACLWGCFEEVETPESLIK